MTASIQTNNSGATRTSATTSVTTLSPSEFLKSGFRMYVSNIRIPIPLDSKWVLESVCVQGLIPATSSGNIYEQAYSYLQNYLFQNQTNITKNKQEWLKLARKMKQTP